MGFNWISKGLLLALIVTSLALFWMRFGRVVERIRGARPDTDFRIGPVAQRSWRFLSEVLLQTKVIRERPLPGLAHAFVFWSFCAFALVTINHFASAFGLALLDRHGSIWGGIYWWFAFVFAAACAVSIAGLAFRRFVIRPKWLEPLSPESGLIAGLIFLLMVTYMPMWWISEASTAGQVIWWVHSLTILAFLPLIPHTKHLHLVLSPFTVFFERRGFSHIPSLSDDEDFGLVAGKDISQISALQAYSCVECGRCTEHCPANNTGKELNPKLIVLGLRSYLNEYGNQSETPILSATVSQTAVFQCTTCGSCEYQCPVGIQHLPAIVGLRRGAVNTGMWEDEQGTRLFLNLERHGNAIGFGASERDRFIAKEQFPAYDGSQEYCLWLGCMGAYDPRGREIVAAFAVLMKQLNTSFGVLKKERCTGDPVRRLGNDLLFGQLAEANIAAIQQSKVKKLVSICPHCVRTIGEDWREFGVEFEIEHHSEFLARHADRLPGRKNGERVVFHDPCYLGRYRGVYDAPRQVIARSAEVIEPARSKQRSFCCGAGGGLVFLGEETGDRVNVTRAKELLATRAPVIGTACPFCNTMFRDALATISQTPPQLLDIAQIAAAGLTAENGKSG